MESESGKLAQSFYSQFSDLFVGECEPIKASLLSIWKDKTAWTKFMLDQPSGFLVRVATRWASRTWNEACVPRNEWLKFDLMLLNTSGGKDWWLTVPVVTIEHENDNGIHDEIWKLACWKSRLKVLITYHDNDDQAASKRANAQQIIANIQRDGADQSEWLFLSAPRTWREQLAWQAHEWDGASWRLLDL
jgi:hypothetical protein